MPYFTTEDKQFFEKNGYIIKYNTVPDQLIQRAIDVIWEHIDADRNDSETWINAGPTGNLPCTNYPDVQSLLHDGPHIDMAEELVGKGTLKVANNPFCKMIYPTGENDWSLPEKGHMDGYTVKGVVSTFTLGITMNLNDVVHRSGGFTVWPGTHLMAAKYFKTHSILNGIEAYTKPLPQPVEIFGPAGTTCFWHHYMMYSASKNCGSKIRMATVSRLRWQDTHDIMFETPDNMWQYWNGIE